VSIVILLWCRFVRQRPNNSCSFPLPLPSSTLFQHSQVPQAVGKECQAPASMSKPQEAFIFSTDTSRPSFVPSYVTGHMPHPVESHTTIVQHPSKVNRHPQQVHVSDSSELSTDPMALEMMLFSRNALARAGINPNSVSISNEASSVSTAISTQPPADAVAAVHEMLQYTSSVLELMTLEQDRLQASAV
jgi:hypothetical protein